jgi:hypothetical protein
MRPALGDLDAALSVLEDALEREELAVSPKVAAAVNQRSSESGIVAGMATTAALDLIFQQQERRLTVVRDGATRPLRQEKNAMKATPTNTNPPLTEVEARSLTARIKTEIKQVCLLLLEAHDRSAWKALGYRSWATYVHAEFGYSRSRSYELLDQARVVQTLDAAIHPEASPFISAHMASLLKPFVSQIIGQIHREAEPSRNPDYIRDIIQATLTEAKQRQLTGSATETPIDGSGGDLPDRDPSQVIDVDQLMLFLGYIADLPSPSDCGIASNVGSQHCLEVLSAAMSWLSDVRSLWTHRELTQSQSSGSSNLVNFRQMSGTPDTPTRSGVRRSPRSQTHERGGRRHLKHQLTTYSVEDAGANQRRDRPSS